MCENRNGTYQCFCPIGFKMNDEGQCQGKPFDNDFMIKQF